MDILLTCGYLIDGLQGDAFIGASPVVKFDPAKIERYTKIVEVIHNAYTYENSGIMNIITVPMVKYGASNGIIKPITTYNDHKFDYNISFQSQDNRAFGLYHSVKGYVADDYEVEYVGDPHEQPNELMEKAYGVWGYDYDPFSGNGSVQRVSYYPFLNKAYSLNPNQTYPSSSFTDDSKKTTFGTRTAISSTDDVVFTIDRDHNLLAWFDGRNGLNTYDYTWDSNAGANNTLRYGSGIACNENGTIVAVTGANTNYTYAPNGNPDRRGKLYVYSASRAVNGTSVSLRKTISAPLTSDYPNGVYGGAQHEFPEARSVAMSKSGKFIFVADPGSMEFWNSHGCSGVTYMYKYIESNSELTLERTLISNNGLTPKSERNNDYQKFGVAVACSYAYPEPGNDGKFILAVGEPGFAGPMPNKANNTGAITLYTITENGDVSFTDLPKQFFKGTEILAMAGLPYRDDVWHFIGRTLDISKDGKRIAIGIPMYKCVVILKYKNAAEGFVHECTIIDQAFGIAYGAWTESGGVLTPSSDPDILTSAKSNFGYGVTFDQLNGSKILITSPEHDDSNSQGLYVYEITNDPLNKFILTGVIKGYDLTVSNAPFSFRSNIVAGPTKENSGTSFLVIPNINDEWIIPPSK